MARKPLTRGRIVAAILLLIVASFGCNPLLLPMQLLNLNKTRPSEYGFYEKARKAKDKKDIKIAVLTYRGRGLSPEYIGAERTLTTLFVAALKAGFAQNKERVTIVPTAEVEKFKQKNDDWRAMEPHEIGAKLGVDFVVDVELASLSLYEPGSRLLFRGHCEIPLRVMDSDPNSETPEFFAHPYSTDYPGSGVTVPADQDMNADKFQNQFLTKVATELTGLFTGVSTGQRFR